MNQDEVDKAFAALKAAAESTRARRASYQIGWNDAIEAIASGFGVGSSIASDLRAAKYPD